MKTFIDRLRFRWWCFRNFYCPKHKIPLEPTREAAICTECEKEPERKREQRAREAKDRWGIIPPSKKIKTGPKREGEKRARGED